MPAIISDQFRILNAENFAKSLTGIGTTNNNYYTFIGLPNSNDVGAGYGTTDWDSNTPAPKDGFREYNDVYDTMIAMKKVGSSDVKRMVRKYSWTAGTIYEMYRNDYTRSNLSPQTGSTNLYDAKYYVVNSQFKVYICINNGASPDNPAGKQSLDEPTFTDLEPRTAGSSGDGYLWKYLYTINPSDIIKFDSIDFIPVPDNWGSGDTSDVKDNAVDGKIETIIVTNKGQSYQPLSTSFTNIPILGDGTGGTATVTVDNEGKVSNVTVTNGGSGYSRGSIQFYPGAPGSETGGPITGLSTVGVGTTSIATFDVIIPPPGGHGADVYRELGAYRVLVYSRYESSTSNPDFIVGNDFARIGIVENPQTATGQPLLLSQASALTAIKLKSLTGGDVRDTTYTVDTPVFQTIGVGSTAVGYVASWDPNTAVLKLYNPVGLASTTYGFRMVDFVSQIGAGGTYVVSGQTSGNALGIDTSFGSSANPGTATTVGNALVQLGQTFIEGVAPPEVKKYSGNVIYIDNRAAIPRSSSQKEDIKIVLEF